MGWLDNKPNVMQADVFVASIIVADSGKTAKEYKIKNAWDMRHMLAGIKRGETFNIRGLGKLRVMSIIDYDKDDDYLYFYELILSCRVIEETAIVPYKPISDGELEKMTINEMLDYKARLQKLVDENYKKTWG